MSITAQVRNDVNVMDTAYQDRDNALVHKNKQQNRDQAVKNDATNLALLSLTTGLGIKSMMLDDQYWNYVVKEDHKYFHDVIKEAIDIKKRVKENPQKYIPPVAPKQQGGAGGAPGGAPPDAGGAPPPAMGLNKNKVLTANEIGGGKFYLHKSNSEFKLKGTFCGRVFSGQQILYTKNGEAFILHLNDGTHAPQSGHTWYVISRIEHEWPDAIIKSIVEKLNEYGLPNATEIAFGIIEESMKSHEPLFPIYNVLPALKNPSMAWLIMDNNNEVPEPEEIHFLRCAIGVASNEYVKDLAQALEMDGIVAKRVFVQDQYKSQHSKSLREKEKIEKSRQQLEELKKVSPHVLESSILAQNCSSMNCLIMTAMATKSHDILNVAILRILEVMLTMPEVYAQRQLTNEEARRLYSKSRNALDLMKLVEASSGDVASFMQVLSWAKETKRTKLIHDLAIIAVNQKNYDVLDADPSLIFAEPINLNALKRLDVRDELSTRLLCKTFKNHPSANAMKRVVAKVMEAAFVGSRDALHALLSSESPNHIFFAISCLYDNNPDGFDGTMITDALRRVSLDSSRGMPSALMASSILKNDIHSPIIFDIDVNPHVLYLIDPESAKTYMKKKRLGIDGSKIPVANEIHSLPEDSLALAKNLDQLGDTTGLLVLCHLVASSIFESQDEHSSYALEYIVSALRHHGMDRELSSILMLNHIDYDSIGQSEEPKPVDVEAVVLPGGLVACGRAGAYSLFDGQKEYTFSCSKIDLPTIAISKIGQGNSIV